MPAMLRRNGRKRATKTIQLSDQNMGADEQ
jgi:hypothetical protein